jgi:hypothetical protein
MATSFLFAKERVGSERCRKLLLVSPHFRRRVEILLAARIALGPEALINRGARCDGICLGKRDSMREE